MKSKHLIFLLFLTFSCKSPDNKLYEFDPRTLVENTITLAEIADDITYLPLDNRYPIGYVNNLKMTKNSIFLNASDGIIAFNRDEKMLEKLGISEEGRVNIYMALILQSTITRKRFM